MLCLLVHLSSMCAPGTYGGGRVRWIPWDWSHRQLGATLAAGSGSQVLCKNSQRSQSLRYLSFQPLLHSVWLEGKLSVPLLDKVPHRKAEISLKFTMLYSV